MAMDSGTGAVWAYWENRPGTTRAAYLDLCLETIERHSPPLELRCLGPDDVRQWVPDVDLDRWYSLPAPNYRSDYLRARVLERHGGIWIDVDTVALSPLSELIELLDNAGMVGYGQELGRFFGGLCVSRPGSAFVSAWVEEQDRVLSAEKDWSKLRYAALAQDVTWELARSQPWRALDMSRVSPIPWYQWRRFLSRLQSPGLLMSASPVTVVLWNAVMGPRLGRLERAQVLRSHMLVSRLLRMGLGLSTAAGEEDELTRLHRLSDLRFSRWGQRVELPARRHLLRQNVG